MTDKTRPIKRTKHDFSSTFDVVVGQLPGDVQRFTVHTDVLTRRSRFFAAARKHEWIEGEEAKPVDLSDDDPEVFQTYLNCVYIGPETLKGIGGAFEREVRHSAEGLAELFVYNICKDVTTKMLVQRCERFGEIKMAKIATLKAPQHGSPRAAQIVFATTEAGEAAMEFFHDLVFHGHRLTVHASFKGIGDLLDHWSLRFEVADGHYDTLMILYLLADKLQDLATANMIIDRIEQFNKIADARPGDVPVSTAYRSTVDGSPLRKLLRNMWFYGDVESPQLEAFPNEFLLDMVKLYMSVKAAGSGGHNFVDVTSSEESLRESEDGIPVQCRYHQHDEEHPFCPTVWKEEEHCETCKSESAS